jgi:hypothetical protein
MRGDARHARSVLVGLHRLGATSTVPSPRVPRLAARKPFCRR